MAGFLKGQVIVSRSGENRISRCNHIWPRDVSRARQSDRVGVSCAAFGREKVVVSTVLVKVRAFRAAERCSGEDVLHRADQFIIPGQKLLEDDSAKMVVPLAVVPDLVEQPFSAVVIVKE